jgi:hypothetical protein
MLRILLVCLFGWALARPFAMIAQWELDKIVVVLHMPGIETRCAIFLPTAAGHGIQ